MNIQLSDQQKNSLGNHNTLPRTVGVACFGPILAEVEELPGCRSSLGTLPISSSLSKPAVYHNKANNEALFEICTVNKWCKCHFKK